MSKIDIILPYVDSADPLWLKDFENTIGSDEPSTVRFRSWGTLKYVLRAIDTYITFDYNLVLIVSRKSQIPHWLDKDKVRIVYHKDFIPEEYLPAFNSCTIEAFLWNIPDISEQFIYFNDDIFPINPISLDDFFSEGTPRLAFSFMQRYDDKNIFLGQCLSSLNAISDALKMGLVKEGQLVIPPHNATPMLKSCVDEVGKLCYSKLCESITPLREHKNINQYIYSDYHFLKDTYKPPKCRFLYFEISDDLTDIQYGFMRSNLKTICLNDSTTIKNYTETKHDLTRLLERRYPEPSIYELSRSTMDYDDLISRKAFIEWIQNYMTWLDEYEDTDKISCAEDILAALKAAQPVNMLRASDWYFVNEAGARELVARLDKKKCDEDH